MTQLSPDTLKEFVLCDATLRGVRWHVDAPHLTLDLELGDGRAATLTCMWARDVRIDLSLSSGPTSSWECTWEQLEGGWRMGFAFPGDGFIQLECSEATLE